MKYGKRVLLIFSIFLVLLLGGLCLYFSPKEVENKEFAVTIVGKNKYGSTLEVKLENSDLTLDNFDCHWWYSDTSDSNNKIYIDGAESYQYKIDEGLVGKYIGVTLTHKDSIGSVSYADVTDEVTNKTKTVSALDTKITLDEEEFVYNGLNIDNTFAKVNVDAEIIYTYYTDKKCTKLTTSEDGSLYDGGSPIDAGTYYVKTSVNDSPNYKSATSECTKVVIKPLDLTVLWSVGDLVYNGSYQGPVASVNNTVTSEVLNLSSLKVVNAGEYVSEAKCVEVIGGRGSCSNFNLVKNVVDFKIDEYNSMIGLSPVVATYSGKPIFANAAITDVPGEINYKYYKDSSCTKLVDVNDGASVDGSAPTDAGNYYVQASISSNGNIASSISSCVEHIIEPKIVPVVWEKIKFVYDGTNKGPTTNMVSGIKNEAIITSTNSSVLPGSYFANATCNRVIGGRGKCSNYLLINEVGNYEIERATASVSLKSKEVVYDGNAVYANDVVTNSDGIVNYVYYTDKYCSNLTTFDDGALYDGGVPVDAGNYYVTAYVGTSDKYNSTNSGCVSHIIKPIDVSIDVYDKVLEYDGNVQKNEYVFDYNKLESENLVLDVNGYVIPGSYENNVFCSYVEGGRGKCRNYKINDNSAKLVIKKATSNITIDCYKKVYDASFINPNVVTNSDGSVIFNYYSDSSCSNLVDYPVDAGKYYVQAITSETAFYKQGISSCVSYEVTPMNVDINWVDSEFIYNSDLQGPVAYAYGVDGSVIEFNTSKNIEAGDYGSTAKCIFVGDGRNKCLNYKFSNVDHEYTISKAYSDIYLDTLEVVTTYPDKYTINFNKIGDKTIECYSNDDSIAKCIINENSITVVPLTLGKTMFTVKVPDSNNYHYSEKYISVNVDLPKYNVLLYYNDGSGNIDVIEKLYNVDTTLPSIVSQNLGYRFMGWSLLEDGRSVDYKAGDLFTKNINKNLYGVWKNIVYINETFDDAEIHNYFEDISGEYIIDGNMKIFNSTSKLVFTPNKDVFISFDMGKINYDGTSSNNFIVEIVGSDNSKYEVYTNSELNNTEFKLNNYKLSKDVTYTLKFTYISDNENNYGYVDNIFVEIDDTVVNYREEKFDFMNLVNSVGNWFSDVTNKLFKFMRNMFN